jgi:hypothetical protein
VRREVQARGIIDWKPLIFPVDRLPKRHIQLGVLGTEIKPTPKSSPQKMARIALMGTGDGVLMEVESFGR